jgi:hypothetical protein
MEFVSLAWQCHSETNLTVYMNAFETNLEADITFKPMKLAIGDDRSNLESRNEMFETCVRGKRVGWLLCFLSRTGRLRELS